MAEAGYRIQVEVDAVVVDAETIRWSTSVE
jgi:hypothetical protein